jgi:hypothetical protein
MKFAYDHYGCGLSWVIDEFMGRTSHALRDDDGGVWFIDPVDVPAAVDKALELGEPRGVIQLLDRHARANRDLAERFGVPFYELPDEVPDSPFEMFSVLEVSRWREKGLWWQDQRVLVVAETVGTVPYFRAGSSRAGIHPFLRAKPPRAPLRYAPHHLLVGHGRGVHGPQTPALLDEAYRRTRRDIWRLPLTLLQR